MVLVQVLNFQHARTGFTHAHTPHICKVYVHRYTHILCVYCAVLQGSAESTRKIITF